MKLKSRTITTALLGLVLGLTGMAMAQMAMAQPETGNAPKNVNPPNLGQDMGNWGNMTPAERQEANKNMVAQVVRDSLKGIGITDEKTVTTVLQFAEAQETARQSVRQKAHIVLVGLIGNALTEAQMATAMEELRQAIDDAKARQKQDIATLEELTDFSKKPKLQASLTMMGLIGDETLFVQGVLSNAINTIGLLINPPTAPEKLRQQ